jgi:hypothetical protein
MTPALFPHSEMLGQVSPHWFLSRVLSIVAYNAGENETTTPAESKAVETFIGTVQKTIADAGGTGKFVERGPGGNQD